MKTTHTLRRDQNPGNQFDFTDPWVNPFLDKLDLVLTTVFT